MGGPLVLAGPGATWWNRGPRPGRSFGPGKLSPEFLNMLKRGFTPALPVRTPPRTTYSRPLWEDSPKIRLEARRGTADPRPGRPR